MTAFEHFRDNYCGHQSGYMEFEEGKGAVAGCSFKDEKSASCWEDWQPCTLENCPFFKRFDVRRYLI